MQHAADGMKFVVYKPVHAQSLAQCACVLLACRRAGRGGARNGVPGIAWPALPSGRGRTEAVFVGRPTSEYCSLSNVNEWEGMRMCATCCRWYELRYLQTCPHAGCAICLRLIDQPEDSEAECRRQLTGDSMVSVATGTCAHGVCINEQSNIRGGTIGLKILRQAGKRYWATAWHRAAIIFVQ